MNVTLETLEQYVLQGLENRFWYEMSNESARAFCAQHGIDITSFLAVVAILSPRVQVSRNIRLAKQWVLEGRNPEGIMSQRVNALENYHATGIVRGTKINAFLQSLLLVDDSVCIDIHMSRLFGYQNGELMSKTKRFAEKRKQAQRIVRKLASRHNMTSYQMQAVLWCGYLRENAARKTGFGSMDFS